MVAQRFRIEAPRESIQIASAEGALLLSGPGPYSNFLYFPHSREQASLPGAWVDLSDDQPSVAVSPSRSALAYVELTRAQTTRVHVVADGGSLLREYLLPEETKYAIVQWLDDVHLALANPRLPDGVLQVMDVRDGSLASIEPVFPLSTGDGPLAWSMRSAYVRYNPTADRAILARFVDNQVEPPLPMKFTFELWDIPTATLLWTTTGGGWSQAPQWSRRGEAFVAGFDSYYATYEHTSDCAALHLVSASAEDRVLDDCVWLGYSWSPDGESIAVWKESSPRSPRLKIFNLMENTVEDYSIHFASDTFLASYLPPVWSPDSRYLAFTQIGDALEPVRCWALDRDAAVVGVVMESTAVRAWLR